MTNVFSEKEIEILQLYLQKKKNKEIADELKVSEPYISQTLSKISLKLESLENSLELLENLGLVDKVSPIRLTETGRKSFKKNLTSLESNSKQKLSTPKDNLLSHDYASSIMPPISGIVDVTPIFKSPHESLKYTITELVKGIVMPSNESIRDLSLRLGIPEDIISDVEKTINQSLFQTPNLSPDIYLDIFNSEKSVPPQVQNYISNVAWVNSPRFQKYLDINLVGFSSPITGLSVWSLQIPSSSEGKPRKIITAGNLSGDIYGR